MKKSILELSFLAEDPVLDGQIVKIGATEGTIVPCGANENPIGICQKTVSAAQIAGYLADPQTVGADELRCPVMIIGVAPVLAGDEVDMNEWVVSDANGRIVPATLDGGDNIIGICLDAATGDGVNTHIQVHRIPETGGREN
jgi:hypothetical protein